MNVGQVSRYININNRGNSGDIRGHVFGIVSYICVSVFQKGFPDYGPPDYLPKILAETAISHDMLHQYTRSQVCLLLFFNLHNISWALTVTESFQGHPRLVNSIASLFSKLHGRDINAMTDVRLFVNLCIPLRIYDKHVLSSRFSQRMVLMDLCYLPFHLLLTKVTR